MVKQKWFRWDFPNLNSDFHTLKAVTSAAEKEICICLRQVKHVPPASCNIIYEIFVNAIIIASFVHLKNIVGMLIKPKIWINWTQKIACEG